jgi:hypothetical protein
MPDLERVQQNTPLTLSQQWYESGAVVDPGTVTLGITRADGTSLVAAGTATSGSGTNPRTFNLTTTHTALLDSLKVTWTSTLKGTLVSYVEVVGGFLFNLNDLSAEVTDSTSSYTAAQMADSRTYAETQLERACGRAFVPRYTTETFNGDCSSSLVLRWPNIRAVRSVMVDGVAYTVGQLAGLAFNPSGILTNTLGTWSLGASNITVSYEHGDSFLDPGASEAALVLAKHKLVRGPIDERATQRTSEFGPVNLATPGMFGSRFGIPVVDAFVQANNMNVGVA